MCVFREPCQGRQSIGGGTTPGTKEQYRQLCETEGDSIPLFQQYWWMETVCAGKHWDVLLDNKLGRWTGAMPFLYGRKLGLKYILQPQLTPWSGPWLHPSLDATGRQATLSAFSASLRRQQAVLCMQCFPPTETDCLAFIQQRFRQTTRYTYRFDPLPEPQALRGLATKERRKGIESVEEAYTVDRAVGVEEFADFHIEYWERRSGRDLLSRDFIQRVCATAIERGQGLLYGLRDDGGALMAARFVVYDSRCAYSLLSAIHSEALRNSMTLLIWILLADLHGRTQAFDFEGGMNDGIGHFYRSFGTRQIPYLCIYRSKIPFLEKKLFR